MNNILGGVLMIIIIKRYNIFIIMFVCIFAAVTYLSLNNYLGSELTIATAPNGIKTILIDPGHGGMDGGATGQSGVIEKDLNLIIANKLADIFTQNNYSIVMTRSKDESLHDNDKASIRNKKRSDLNKRRALMSTSGANVFISIHMNKFAQTKYSGAQVFYSRANENSKVLGELIQKELVAQVDTANNRAAKSADNTIFILKNAPIPAVIVECGFLSNSNEEALLQKDEYQQKIAKAIFVAVDNYINSVGS